MVPRLTASTKVALPLVRAADHALRQRRDEDGAFNGGGCTTSRPPTIVQMGIDFVGDEVEHGVDHDAAL